MKEDVFKKIKNEVEEKIVARNEFKRELDKLRSEVRIKQMHPAVCSFFESLEKYKEKENIFNNVFDTNINMLIQTVEEYAKLGLFSDTNKIFFYRGSFTNHYDEKTIGMPVQCLRYDGIAEYDLYIDIESLKKVKNPIENRDSFESINNVIIVSAFPVQKNFDEIRMAFFKTAVEQNQEEAAIKVLSKK